MSLKTESKSEGQVTYWEGTIKQHPFKPEIKVSSNPIEVIMTIDW